MRSRKVNETSGHRFCASTSSITFSPQTCHSVCDSISFVSQLNEKQSLFDIDIQSDLAWMSTPQVQRWYFFVRFMSLQCYPPWYASDCEEPQDSQSSQSVKLNANESFNIVILVMNLGCIRFTTLLYSQRRIRMMIRKPLRSLYLACYSGLETTDEGVTECVHVTLGMISSSKKKGLQKWYMIVVGPV